MKHTKNIFIFLFNFLGFFANNAPATSLGLMQIETFKESLEQIEAHQCSGICILLELSSGPELNLIEQGSTGAIIEEFIKAIEQEVIIIASALLGAYLKLVLQQKPCLYNQAQRNLENYLLFQTEADNFILLIPNKIDKIMQTLGLNNSLKRTHIDTLKANPVFEINMKELMSIFHLSSNQEPLKKLIYLSGHGIPMSQSKSPSIANLTLAQYKELVDFLNTINCGFLFVSSCYAAGINMVTAHLDLLHKFPIVIGNLTDSFSSFNEATNFKNYFTLLNKAFQIKCGELDFLHSLYFNKALKKICGQSVNNTPWLKLPSYEQFFLLNLNNHKILDDNENKNKSDYLNYSYSSQKIQQPTSIEICDEESLLISSAVIQKNLKFIGKGLPKIISVIPGKSSHIFRSINAKNQTFNDFINTVLAISYEFKKVFVFKKIKIKWPKKKAHKFKIKTIKNILLINHGTPKQGNASFFKDHELYFQRGAHYYRMLIPVGIKLGYYEAELEIIPPHNKKTIFTSYLKGHQVYNKLLTSNWPIDINISTIE